VIASSAFINLCVLNLNNLGMTARLANFSTILMHSDQVSSIRRERQLEVDEEILRSNILMNSNPIDSQVTAVRSDRQAEHQQQINRLGDHAPRRPQRGGHVFRHPQRRMRSHPSNTGRARRDVLEEFIPQLLAAVREMDRTLVVHQPQTRAGRQQRRSGPFAGRQDRRMYRR
jgi:hypothetical protein